MLRDITFGQYHEGNSPLHKTDPRIKILLLIAVLVFVFIANNVFSVCFAAVSVFSIIFLSGVPFKKYAKNMKTILPIIIFTAVINIFYGDKSTGIIFEVWKLTVTYGGLYRAIFMALRITLLIFISSALTYTTTPNDLTDAIERLLSPLKFIGLKTAVHVLAMMMTITLRFIPTLIEETEKIMNAQKARGADLESGSLKERVKALIPILIPLLISAIRRSYELAEAMECRCYNGGEGRQRMKQMHLNTRDYLACIIVFLGGAVVVILNIIR